MRTNHSTALGLVSMALLAQTGCQQPDAGAPEPNQPRLVFITTGTNSFWHRATAGIEAAAKDFKVQFEMLSESGAVDRTGADGMAFAPIDGAVQLVSSSGGMCFLGIDHYKAGRKAGELVKEALPDGGKIIIFGAAALERRQGIMDELTGAQFIVMDGKNPFPSEAACVVALSAPDLSVCLDALCAADKLGQIKIIGFDADEATLATSELHGIVTHQPYQYGYHAVRVLAGLARGDKSVLPKSGFLEIPAVILRPIISSHAAARPLH